jgi:hypothetical protein
LNVSCRLTNVTYDLMAVDREKTDAIPDRVDNN